MPKEPSFNKEYLSEKLLAMKEKLGDAYGGPLMEKLIIRMQTVAHFDFEVETMLKKVTKRTNERKSTLDNIRGEEINENVSDYEKKLESSSLEDKGTDKSETKDSESDVSNEKRAKKVCFPFSSVRKNNFLN